jgi:hypothetical protein
MTLMIVLMRYVIFYEELEPMVIDPQVTACHPMAVGVALACDLRCWDCQQLRLPIHTRA